MHYKRIKSAIVTHDNSTMTNKPCKTDAPNACTLLPIRVKMKSFIKQQPFLRDPGDLSFHKNSTFNMQMSLTQEYEPVHTSRRQNLKPCNLDSETRKSKIYQQLFAIQHQGTSSEREGSIQACFFPTKHLSVKIVEWGRQHGKMHNMLETTAFPKLQDTYKDTPKLINAHKQQGSTPATDRDTRQMEIKTFVGSDTTGVKNLTDSLEASPQDDIKNGILPMKNWDTGLHERRGDLECLHEGRGDLEDNDNDNTHLKGNDNLDDNDNFDDNGNEKAHRNHKDNFNDNDNFDGNDVNHNDNCIQDNDNDNAHLNDNDNFDGNDNLDDNDNENAHLNHNDNLNDNFDGDDVKDNDNFNGNDNDVNDNYNLLLPGWPARSNLKEFMHLVLTDRSQNRMGNQFHLDKWDIPQVGSLIFTDADSVRRASIPPKTFLNRLIMDLWNPPITMATMTSEERDYVLDFNTQDDEMGLGDGQQGPPAVQ